MNIKEFGNDLIKLIEKNNEHIRQHEALHNYEIFHDIIEYLQIFIEEITKSKGYNINIIKVNEILREILEAFSNKDFILMSDIFEYELIEELKSIIE